MKIIDETTSIQNALNRIVSAAEKGIWGGRQMDEYFESCRWQLSRYSCVLIFTREVGYHSSGWWKNPDYERCWHLSISFAGGKNKPVLEKIMDRLFGQFKRWIWVEPPYSQQGKQMGVWHYRLFCDEHWIAIKPRGEVYDTEFTERGWKSFGELNATI